MQDSMRTALKKNEKSLKQEKMMNSSTFNIPLNNKNERIKRSSHFEQ